MSKKITGPELRRTFIEYFKKLGHTEVASSALVPDNDPTLLFSNAGMNQFKDCFLGSQKRAYTRAVSSQKCLRISGKHNDLENVGMTARHHTFFEMLGNFSFGDYFKADAIKFAWELITKELKISKDKLWVTIYEKDEEAGKLWQELTDVLPGRILKLGEKDNFWAMGETGPCGPCSEIHYYMGEEGSEQSEEAFRRDDGSYLEIWNLVFMQFNRAADGTLNPLPKPSVDTGMGLERVASVLQGVKSNYDTDLLREIIAECEKLSGFKYNGSSFEIRDLKKDKEYARDVAMRVIADHSRAIAFLIADGVTPSSDGRGYVLRRLIRRAARHGRVLNFKDTFLNKTCKAVIDKMFADYPELKEKEDLIVRVSEAEEKKFYETLDAGLVYLNKECQKLKSGDLFSGDTAFLLHDTYGFPLDLTADVLKVYNLQIDIATFEKCMQQQKTRSRDDRKANAAGFLSIKIDSAKTEFLGYQAEESESKALKIVALDGSEKSSFNENEETLLIFDSTPFYAESGGQVGDTGIITFKDCQLQVNDTQKIQDGHFVHTCKIIQGELNQKLIGSKAHLRIDSIRRSKIRVNHSATHLVHSALRNILGEHVKQAGSRVDENTLRFDYSHFSAPEQSQLIAIQTYVNQEIRSNYEINTAIMGTEEAKKSGAMALFGEKYGDKVRVVEIGPNSKELCGGTHSTRSGDIGFVLISSENGVSSGVRRIECYAGAGAHNVLLDNELQRSSILELLKGDGSDLSERVEKQINRIKTLEKELDVYKSKLASASSSDLTNNTRTSPSGIKLIVEKVDTPDTDTLKSLVDNLRNKIGSGVVALGSNVGEHAIIVAGATSDLSGKVHVGNILKEALKTSGGKGGGRADFAQAGGVNPAFLNETLNKFLELVL